MPDMVYLFSGIVAAACAGLLARGHRQTGRRLLLWSAVCFACLALENVILFVDVGIGPQADLRPYRDGVALAGMVALVYGLVWEQP